MASKYRTIVKLAGPSAFAYRRVSLRIFAFIFSPALVVFLISLPSAQLFGRVVQMVLLALFLLSGLSVLLLWSILGYRKEGAEIRHGYTSQRDLVGQFCEVAPGTNVVIREENEPLLTKPEFRAAVTKARGWYNALPPNGRA